jgi:hypothetical protein
MKNIDKKKGKFFVSYVLIKSRPELVQQIMGACIVVRAEALYTFDGIEYYALSEHFRPLEEGDKIPEYEGKIENNIVSFREVIK